MAKVPYNPVSQVTPIGGNTPKLTPRGVEGAFGEKVAAATEHLGATVEKLGDEVFKRALAMQELANETEAKDAETRYTIKAGQMRADFGALSGKAAVDAYPGYMENLKKEREAIREGLSNDASRRVYDRPSLNIMSNTIYNGAGHAATENKKWAIGTEKSSIDATGADTLTTPNDDVMFQRNRQAARQSVAKIGVLQGLDENQTGLLTQQVDSDLWLKRVVGMSRDEPFKAQKLFEKAKADGLLKGEDIDKAEKVVQQGMLQVGSRVIADKVTGDTLQERLDAGLAEAERSAPGDVQFKDYVQQRIHGNWNRHQQVKRDDTYVRKDVVEGALMGGKSGSIPVSPEEMFKVDPKSEAAWHGLDNKDRRRYMDIMARNAKGDVSWTEDRLKRYQEILGLSTADPQKFLEMSMVDEDLPFSTRQAFIKAQQQIMKKSEGNPAVSKAIDILRPDLVAAGVRMSNTDPTYLQFRGALHDQIMDWQQEHKVPPKPKEIQEIGRRLLQEQSVGLFSRQLDDKGYGKTRTFELNLPSQAIESIRGKLEDQYPGLKFTEEQIQREYVRQQMNKFYAGKPSAAKPTGGDKPVIDSEGFVINPPVISPRR